MKTTKILALIVGTSLLSLTAMPVLAQTSAPASTTTATQIKQAAQLAKIISRSNTEIAARITSLNNLNTKIQALKNVSDTEKVNISAQVQTNISGLTALQTKIDADKSLTTARTDEQAIFSSYRIYALVIPKGYITSSADRVNVIVGMMTTIGTKLQTRINAAQTSGKDASALQTYLTDFTAKLNDATSQASTALNAVASLIPDQGNKTQLQINTAALKSAQIDIKTASKDLQTARQDAQHIIQGLKALNVKSTGK